MFGKTYTGMNELYRNSPFLLTNNYLYILLDECCANKRDSQKKLYEAFYEYGIGICMRYANREDDAIEIMNDAFLKIFRELKKFEPKHDNAVADFKAWIKRIIINTAIDHYRKYLKHNQNKDLNDDILLVSDESEDQLEKLSYKEIIESIQHLPPVYRTVFSLFAIDGYTHEEISKQLGIAVGTSKSNLSKARMHLQRMLMAKQNFEHYEQRAI
jgi:RNA polymerase sigma-70 factor (ECF subfamily)